MSIASSVRRTAIIAAAVTMAATVGLAGPADAQPSVAEQQARMTTYVASDPHSNGKGGSGVVAPLVGGGFCGDYSGLKCVEWGDWTIYNGNGVRGYNTGVEVSNGVFQVRHFCSNGTSLVVAHYGSGGSYLRIQSDGNLVLYNSNGSVWASRTSGHDNAFLAIQADGNVVIYNAPDPPSQNQFLTAIWASGTVGTC
jgi:hypothetical protein